MASMILVTGGTGFLGRATARALLARGERVLLMGRTFAGCADLVAAGAVPLCVELRDYEAVVAACQGTEIVIHSGALSAPWGRRADFLAVNVGGTQAIINGCERHGVRRLVYVSSPSVVFDGRDQHAATEQVPYPRRFASVYSWSKKLGEDAVNAAAQGGLDAVIVRPKALFGPGDTSLLPRLVAAARANRLPHIGHGRNLIDLTYVDNAADALVLAATVPAAQGKTYTITNGEHVALWPLIADILRRLRVPYRPRRMPVRAALVAAGLMEARAALTGREPLLTRYTVQLLARTQTYNILAAQRDLGYAPRVSVADGIDQTLGALI